MWNIGIKIVVHTKNIQIKILTTSSNSNETNYDKNI